MDVLLVNPNSRFADGVDPMPLIVPPLNLMYVAQSLRHAGYAVKIHDAYAQNTPQGEVLDIISRSEAKYVGMPLYSSDLTMMHTLTREIKESMPEKEIFLAGPHVTALPEQVMRQYPHIDHIVRGEGERITPELVDALEAGRTAKGVRGVSYRDEGNIRHNLDRQAEPELDSFPIPDRDMIDSDLYFSHLTSERTVDTIITSRGCPYKCTFCYRLTGDFNRYRVRSVDNVIEEMRHIQERGTRGLEIRDETFTLHKKRVLQILRKMRKEKLDFNFRFLTRVSHVDDELLKEFKKTGCTVISYGVESGSQHILDLMQKEITLPMVRDAFRKTERHGMDILGMFMVGNQGETPETIRQTVAFAKELNPLYATFTAHHPFPGTPDYERAKLDGSLVGEYAPFQPRPWIKMPWLEKLEDLYDYSDWAYKSFYRRSAYAKKYASSVTRQRNWNLLKYSTRTFLRRFSRIDQLNNYRS